MAVPYTFGSATTSIPLSQLDSNFATTITLGNTAIQLGNTVTTLNNMTLANVTISSGTSNLASTSISNGTSNVTVNSSGGNISMATNGTTAVTIDTSQNVGIGTASPAVKLDVRQSSASDLQLSLYNNNAGVYASSIKLNADNATGSYYNAIQSYNATTGQWQIGGAGSSSTIVFGTGSSFTERARVNAYGIGLGGAIPSSGTGIAFPATQSASSDANTLDDYEEGTFTPSYSLASGSITFASGPNGKYTKIGNLVTATVYLFTNTVSSPSGRFQITGYPFTFNSSVQSAGGVAAYNMAAGAYFISVEASQNTTSSILFNFANGVRYELGPYLQANTQLVITISYQV
jgi:hypothetical protein